LQIMMNLAQLARTDINLLVLFEVAYQERHLGRAAQRLGLTASAISHGLNRLRRLLHDPLFLRTPRGVVPTARATDLAEPVADILARVNAVLGSARPFDAKHSRRRFTIGAPDALSAIFLPSLLARIHTQAPGIDLAVREAFPNEMALTVERAWDAVRDRLEARTFDVAVIPAAKAVPRFARRRLGDTRFVIAARAGHPYLRKPSLDRFCAAEHVVVSQIGDARGFIDAVLAKHKRERRVALTVPNFMLALALLPGTDLLAAVPLNLIEEHGARLGLKYVEAPVVLPTFDPVYVIASRAALLDGGVAWLFSQFGEI
jgi:DNA-binding transcriptional LysR family regulator